MSHDERPEIEEASPDDGPRGPQGPQKIVRQPLTNDDGWKLLSAAAVAAGSIALATLVLEIATGQWLANALGFGFFVTTPLGIGATFLTGLVARNDIRRAAIPAAIVASYWLIYLLGSMT